MTRIAFAGGFLLGLVALAASATAPAQDLATRRANRTILAQEREILNRVTQRIEWDKQLTGSTLKVEVQPGGMVLLKGSVMSESAKARAADLVENTTGVNGVTDELAVVRNVKVIDATTDAPVDEVATRPAPAPAPAAPSASRVILKP